MFAVIFVLITLLLLKDIFSFIGKLFAKLRNSNEGPQPQMYREFPNLDPVVEYNANISSNIGMSQTTVDTSGRIFGHIKLAFFFYQVAGIIRIGSSAKANYHTAFLIELITLIFNIKLGSSTVSTDDNILGRWCPLQTTNVLLMELLHNSIILWCLLLIISFSVKTLFQYTITKFFSAYTSIHTTYANGSFVRILKCGMVQFLLLGFASITKICFDSVHCIEINHKWFLYKQAETVECCHGWQYGVFVVIAGCVILFPFTLYIGVMKLRSKSLSPNEFLLILFIPPSMILFLVRSCLRSNTKHGRQQYHHENEETFSPIDVDLTGDNEVIHFDDYSQSNGNSTGTDRAALLAIVTGPFKTIPGHSAIIEDGDEYNP